MKTSTNLTTGASSNAVSEHLRTATSVHAVPRLIFDWNLNRYTTPTANNTPSEDTDGFDIESFPIESLFEPRRPTKGIAKALVGQGVAVSKYTDAQDIKFYIGDQNDIYKYWVSPYPTNGSKTFPLHTDSLTTARPRVEYTAALQTNKIIVRFETSWATPDDYNVQIKTTTGGSYSNIGGASPVIANDGTCTLYYNGTAWVTTRPTTLVTTAVAGIQLVVRTMKGGTDRAGNPTTYIKKSYDLGSPSTLGTITTHTTDGSNSNLAVIAIEPHLEVDFSDRYISDQNTFDYSAASSLYPIGTTTSNTASVTLSNDDRLLDEENTSSPYYKLIRQNAEANLEYIFTIDGVKHSVQQFKMYTGLWSQADDGTVQVPLTDYSKYFDVDEPRSFMWQNITASEAVWRICDSVGFVDYNIDIDDRTTDHTIPVFWSDGTKTVWQLFDELATATQTAIYFDSYGVLQVKMREAAFDDTASPNVHLFGYDTGTDLANIISRQNSDELQVNKVTVTYKTTDWKVGTTGKPALDYVWQPDSDSLVVRSTPLQKNIISTSTAIWINQKVAPVWPYKSKVEIGGEIIQYEGKEYIYWTGDGTVRNSVWLTSGDDLKKYDKLSNNTKNKNFFSGALKITQRGLWNSSAIDHPVDASGWSTKQFIYNNGSVTTNDNPRGFKFNKTDSTVTIDTPARVKDNRDLYFVYQGSPALQGYKFYGTRFQFPTKGRPNQRAGIGFQINGANFSGYYVEVIPSNKIDNKDYKNTSEVQIWTRNGNTWKKLDQGKHVAIRPPRWYDLDVYVTQGSPDKIVVYLNGQMVASATASGGDKQPDSARVAMYARGKTTVNFEYFYGINRSTKDPIDNFGFWDLKNGGMRSNGWLLDGVWDVHNTVQKRPKKGSTKNKKKWTGYLFDEFGPYVHEIREFDVKFDPSPAQYSQLFMTNNWGAAPVEYYSDAFSAHFTIANVSRENAILKGGDKLVFSGGDEVNQVCAVLGRILVMQDDQEVTSKNDDAIRIDGEVESELTSDWIQSELMAQDIADWMNNHWSLGVDQMDITVFGNPCYELGDIVDIDWPANNMTPSTHKYFIVGINTSFASGINTQLTVRRVNPAS